MTQWTIKYRGRDDMTEESVEADKFIDSGVRFVFVADASEGCVVDGPMGDLEKILRLRASNVVEVRSAKQA